MSLSSSVAPKMTSGIEMARPRINRVTLPPAAAATAITLSRLITRSATRMVLIAASNWSLALMSSSPSSGISSFTPIQKSSRLPTSLSHGNVRSATAKRVRITRKTIAAAEPQMTACFCCLAGSERAASAMTTALSPDRMTLTPMIFSRPSQKACDMTSSSMGAILEQTYDLAVDEVDLVRRRHLGQARHGHDVAADHHYELGARRQAHFAHVYHVVRRRAPQRSIGRKGRLGLRHAHREVAVAVFLQLLDLAAHLGVSRHL